MDKIRIITAAALFDGHDVSINIFRRLLQKQGIEVIHLGHNRSVREVALSAIEEDADAILVSSYQGGHNEYFRYLVDVLKEHNADNILVFGGGGGVILPTEIKELEKYGVEKLYHADEGRRIGINGIVKDIIERIQKKSAIFNPNEYLKSVNIDMISSYNIHCLGRCLTVLENRSGFLLTPALDKKLEKIPEGQTTILGITGTGGSGKSSLTDELVNRFLKVSPDIRIAILAVDPTKSTSGGALLGDRIRMNSIYHDRVYMRSFATRGSSSELSGSISDAIRFLKKAGFDLIIVETSGIGQGDHQITKISDYSIYVMTSEFGAPTQLDKIDMLDLADFIVVNKADKTGAEDALREVILRYIKNREIRISHTKKQSILNLNLPVFATNASEFNNHGVNKLFREILKTIRTMNVTFQTDEKTVELLSTEKYHDFSYAQRQSSNYLAQIADIIKYYYNRCETEINKTEQFDAVSKILETASDTPENEVLLNKLSDMKNNIWENLDEKTRKFITNWPEIKDSYSKNEMTYTVRGKEISVPTRTESICGTPIPKVALPRYRGLADLITFCYKENLPGYFPYTAGVFPFKRTYEDPKRQFAGEGTPERTNKRFHYLSRNDEAKRLSVAFDGITLYGRDPDCSPDIYGKIGESGVSICTLNDMKRLLAGFELTHPLTSVSMTINGPAPIMLAMYFMAAVAQEEEKHNRVFSPKERIQVFQKLRGTVQADILKEDQAQNTCIFSIDFALKMMGDIQKYFAEHHIKNYYTISISGYHIAEAGANPITQLAFTLANGFYYVEYFKNLGIAIDEFAPNLSFFFSNGMDPEYSVIGRVARRIWAIAMKEKYGAESRSQKLKYHIQTSGRSLHAQEIEFNDIRTTIQALLAFYDNCNSLHTNAYDEAVTTPTEESVRRAMAIQLILSKEFGMLKNENPNQGSFIIEELTDLVEEAVLEEFYRISYRGGVKGAMEKQYHRAKIQEESLYYEELKHSGEYPLIGVNTFINPEGEDHSAYENMEVIRASDQEKKQQLQNLEAFKKRNAGKREKALESLKETVLNDGNIFEELLNSVQVLSLGEITGLLFSIGGEYRRNM